MELWYRNPNTLERVLNQIALSTSIAGKCAPMQVVKQPEYGPALATKEQKCPSFQMNYNYGLIINLTIFQEKTDKVPLFSG